MAGGVTSRGFNGQAGRQMGEAGGCGWSWAGVGAAGVAGRWAVRGKQTSVWVGRWVGRGRGGWTGGRTGGWVDGLVACVLSLVWWP